MQQKTLADIAAFETVLSERIKALAGLVLFGSETVGYKVALRQNFE